ncbi:hypothetical protein QFZ78_005415 [Paenibacillus sp. V4I5]|nr:hypothetical protein [Paenibacillus sp. V4I5]
MKIIKLVDNELRKTRNVIVHEFYKDKKKDIIDELLPNNMNVDRKIRNTYDYLIKNKKIVYKIAEMYIYIITNIPNNGTYIEMTSK